MVAVTDDFTRCIIHRVGSTNHAWITVTEFVHSVVCVRKH